MSKTSEEIIEEIGDFFNRIKQNSTETITIDSSDTIFLDADSLDLDDLTIDSSTSEYPILDFDVDLASEWQDLLGVDPCQSTEDLENMCEQYPSLKRSLEQFRQFYKLTIDDWRNQDNEI